MKKLIVGFIAGAVFMLSAQAFGAGISFTGKKVDGETPITIDGSNIGNAIVIGGKSFAPVRELANGLGGKVNSANSGGISLSSGIQSNLGNASQVNDLNDKISSQQAVVNQLTSKISDLQNKVDSLKSQGIEPSTQIIELNLTKQQLKKETAKLESLKSQLQEIEG